MLSMKLHRYLFFLALFLFEIASPAMSQLDTSVKTNGDINGDDVFDTLDLVLLERIVIDRQKGTEEQLKRCDVDGDGDLTNYDLLVLTDAYKTYQYDGMDLFESLKTAIDKDLSKGDDNVDVHLDLARFYRKEGMLERSSEVLDELLENLSPNHPLYETVTRTRSQIEDEVAMHEMMNRDDALNSGLYYTGGNAGGKVSLRRGVIQMQSQLSELLEDNEFSGNFNAKRTKAKMNALMENMLRNVGKDQLVDPADFTKLGNQLRETLEDPDNLVKDLSPNQKNKLSSVIDGSVTDLRNQALSVRQSAAKANDIRTGNTGSATQMVDKEMLSRRAWQPGTEGARQSADLDRLVVANPPVLEPDTIGIVAPNYTIKWDISNVLGAQDVALEISKADQKFINPNGVVLDDQNTLYYTPSLGSIVGSRKGSALELEGVGTYYYRVAALNNNGDLISRFSDATPLVVLYNNITMAANKPVIRPKRISRDNPDYVFRWDVSNISGAADAAVEISQPNTTFDNPNGNERDRSSTFFYNPSLGKASGTFSSNIDGLSGPGVYFFRVIALSPYGDYIGRWSDVDTLFAMVDSVSGIDPLLTKTPDSPEVEKDSTGYTVNWDVSDIDDADGITIEVVNDSGDSLNSKEEVVISETVKDKKGQKKIDQAQMRDPGTYKARTAAVDSSGQMLGNWSKPAQIAKVEKTPVVAVSSERSDGGGIIKSKQQFEISPDAVRLEVVSNNTPLYKNREPSSSEVASLKSGDILVKVGGDGLWYQVFFPQIGEYGWVLTYNVRQSE